MDKDNETSCNSFEEVQTVIAWIAGIAHCLIMIAPCRRPCIRDYRNMSATRRVAATKAATSSSVL